MIERDPEGAAKADYDIVVVGGGVYGAALFFEAAARGKRVLLLEAKDFGSRTSAQTLRILHGGLRYLQSLDVRRFRESVRQRRWWMREFPTLVRPLPCLMPLYGRGLHRRIVLGPVLRINDLFSGRRNEGLDPAIHLPDSRLLDPKETLGAAPCVPSRGLRGAALWYDGSMESPARLLMELLRRGSALGGLSLNYVDVTGLRIASGRVRGVLARDRVSGTELEFRAPLVFDATGPRVSRLAERSGVAVPAPPPMALAFNLLVSRSTGASCALAVQPPDSRGGLSFVRPVGDFTFAGTVHAPWPVGREAPTTAPPELVRSFLSSLDEALPEAQLGKADVIRDYVGLVPAAERGSARAAGRPILIDYGRAGGPSGLVGVTGVKYTTAPGVARRVVEKVFGSMSSSPGPLRSELPASRPFLDPGEFEALKRSSPDDAIDHLRTLVREELVVSVEDLVLRRLDWDLHLGDLDAALRDLASDLARAGLELPLRPPT